MPAESPIQARSTEALSGPVSDFLRSTGDKPYRKVVEYHMRRQSAELLTKAMWGEVSALPEGFRSYVEIFIDAVNGRIGYDQRFWQQSTCRQGFDVIMEVAMDVFPIADLVTSPKDLVGPENQDWLFGLFQIATLNLAYSASSRRNQRRFMGIRRGIFR